MLQLDGRHLRKGSLIMRKLRAVAPFLATILIAHLFGIAPSLVRLYMHAGLMLLMLSGIALGRPLIIGYAHAPLEKLNKVAAAWAAAFGVLALADLLLVLRPAWTHWLPMLFSAATLLVAARYTLQVLGKRPQRNEAA